MTYQPNPDERFENAFIDKLYPQEILPLEEVQKEPVGSLFWVNSRGLERVFAYRGDDDFIGLELNYDVNSKKHNLRFSRGQYAGKQSAALANDVFPVIKVGILPDDVLPTELNQELMTALMQANVDFWDEFIDWCKQGIVKKVFGATESYAEKMQLAIHERDMYVNTLQGIEAGSLRYNNGSVWILS